jgi:hypothetical protein
MTATASNEISPATLRRLLRLLGAHPAHVSDPRALRGAALLIRDRVRRSGIPVQLYEPEGLAPAVVAGHGPTLLVCYLDDADPNAMQHSGQPAVFRNGVVLAPGIVRKGGLAAALGYLLDMPEARERITLFVETDRHQGSQTLEHWLRAHAQAANAALWETVDLPIDTPALFHAACGSLAVRVLVTARHHAIESLYGGVVPDSGFGLLQALAALKSTDQEVRLVGFYERAAPPDTGVLETLSSSAPRVAAWITRTAGVSEPLPAGHVAMGIFVAPSLTIRELRVDDEHPYLPRAAQAVIELNLVPGQTVEDVFAALTQYFGERLPQAVVEPLEAREPAAGVAGIDALRTLCPRAFAVAPGPNPAGLLAEHGVPHLGYAAVGRELPDQLGQLELNSVQEGAQLIARVVESLGRSSAAERA